MIFVIFAVALILALSWPGLNPQPKKLDCKHYDRWDVE